MDTVGQSSRSVPTLAFSLTAVVPKWEWSVQVYRIAISVISEIPFVMGILLGLKFSPCFKVKNIFSSHLDAILTFCGHLIVCCRLLDWKWIILTVSLTMHLCQALQHWQSALSGPPLLYPFWLHARLLGAEDWLNYRSLLVLLFTFILVIIHINFKSWNLEGMERNLLTCVRGLGAAEQLVVTDEKGLGL